MRELFKNNKGSAVAILILLVPAIIGATFVLSYGKMFQTGHEKRIGNIINNELNYAAEIYGNIGQDSNGENYCIFTHDDLFGFDFSSQNKGTKENPIDVFDVDKNADCFFNEFYSLFTKIDGYNQKWNLEMYITDNRDKKIEEDKSELNTYIGINVHIELPKKYGVDRFGYLTDINNSIYSTGWYNDNLLVFNELLKLQEEAEQKAEQSENKKVKNVLMVFDIEKMASAI